MQDPGDDPAFLTHQNDNTGRFPLSARNNRILYIKGPVHAPRDVKSTLPESREKTYNENLPNSSLFSIPGTQSGPCSPLPHRQEIADLTDEQFYPVPYQRAQSQPLEQVTFTRGGVYLGEPFSMSPGRPKVCRKHPYGRNPKRTKLDTLSPRSSELLTPSPRPVHRKAPASTERNSPSAGQREVTTTAQLRAPQFDAPTPYLLIDLHTPNSSASATNTWTDYNHQNAVMRAEDGRSFVQRHRSSFPLDMLEHEASGLGSRFMNDGITGEYDDNYTQDLVEAERQRAEVRHANSKINHIDEEFQDLPRPHYTLFGGIDDEVFRPPKCGREIRYLDEKSLRFLLDAYSIPYTPLIPLNEQKAIYLQFIGANRWLAHQVLN